MHDKMIADNVRVDAYYRAIRKYVNAGDVVLDLGTGTGILAFFAAQNAPGRIYAIDHGDIITAAQRLASANNIRNITFLHTHSRDLDIPEKVDVLIHEQIGEKLFDEDMIANICDLRDRFLAPNGRIIPSRFELFIEPVRIKDAYRVPLLWEHECVKGVRYSYLKDALRDEYIRNNQNYYWRSIGIHEVDYLLSEPKPAYKVDLLRASKADTPMAKVFNKTVTRPGRMDGLLVYFGIIFDDQIRIDNSPFSEKTHWNPVLYRCEARHLQEGAVLNVRWKVGHLSDANTWTLSVDPA